MIMTTTPLSDLEFKKKPNRPLKNNYSGKEHMLCRTFFMFSNTILSVKVFYNSY